MAKNNQNMTFEKLSADLSKNERKQMLDKIKASEKNLEDDPAQAFLQDYDEQFASYNIALSLKLKEEPGIYKFFLMLRSLISRDTQEKIYEDDVLMKYVKNVMIKFPGIVDHKILRFQEPFYNMLVKLNETAEFFSPFIQKYQQKPAEFYSFLCSSIAPDYYDAIESHVYLRKKEYIENPTRETRSALHSQLDSILSKADDKLKNNIYSYILSVEWLMYFTKLPIKQFISEFTNIDASGYTCPYGHAAKLVDDFAPVFIEILPLKNELLSIIYKYMHKDKKKTVINDVLEMQANTIEAELQGISVQQLTGNYDVDPEIIENLDKDKKEMEKYLVEAGEKIVNLKKFIKGNDIYQLGKIVNMDYGWKPSRIKFIGDWFSLFRDYWNNLLEKNWNRWMFEKRIEMLAKSFQTDFKVSSLPLLQNRPWEKINPPLQVLYKYSSGFSSWFAHKVYPKIIVVLDDIYNEGDFKNYSNKNEFTKELNILKETINMINNMDYAVSDIGRIGKEFADALTALGSQEAPVNLSSKLKDLVIEVERLYSKSISNLQNTLNILCNILQGILGSGNNEEYEGLVNINQIKNVKNKEWKRNLVKSYNILVKCHYYIKEIISLDNI